MSHGQTRWRPPPRIRAISIGIVQRADAFLLMAVPDDTGALKGWRPLGGAIELGETAAEVLVREFREEIGQELIEPRQIAVLENLYEHHGAKGHEIVFVFVCRFADSTAYARDFAPLRDGNVTSEIAWVPVAHLGNPAPLFPEGLLSHLVSREATG